MKEIKILLIRRRDRGIFKSVGARHWKSVQHKNEFLPGQPKRYRGFGGELLNDLSFGALMFGPVPREAL